MNKNCPESKPFRTILFSEVNCCNFFATEFLIDILSLAFLWKKEMTFAAIKIHFLQTET
jgi:hypothetical protein